MKPPEDDPLDSLLQEWQVTGETSASFQREVWARIAATQADPSWWEKLSALLLRPAGWMAVSAAAVLLGAGFGWLETRPEPVNPHEAYVRSISPFASMHLAAH